MVEVGADGCLGTARRTGGEQDRRRIERVHRLLGWFGGSRVGNEVCVVDDALGKSLAPYPDHAPDTERVEVDLSGLYKPFSVGDQHARAGLIDQSLQFRRFQPGIEWHDDGAQQLQGPERKDPLRVVAHRDGDPVTVPDLECVPERMRERDHLEPLFVECPPLVPVDHGIGTAVRPRREEGISQCQRIPIEHLVLDAVDDACGQREEAVGIGETFLWCSGPIVHFRHLSIRSDLQADKQDLDIYRGSIVVTP